MSIVLVGSTSGSITLQEPAVAGSTTINLPATSGTAVVGSAAVSAAGQIPFSTDGSTYTPTAKIVSGTSVASTSGTSIDFTSIPSWVKRITVMFSGVSTNGTSNIQIQIGTGGSPTTSGYLGAVSYIAGLNTTNSNNFTAGFGISNGVAATHIYHGLIIISLLDSSANRWAYSSSVARSETTVNYMGAGSVALSGVLNLVRITTANGTDTFDAGSINILYE